MAYLTYNVEERQKKFSRQEEVEADLMVVVYLVDESVEMLSGDVGMSPA